MQESVNGVVLVRFGESHVVVRAVEAVVAVAEAVGPWDQRSTVRPVAHLTARVGLQNVTTAEAVRADAAPDLNDRGVLLAVGDVKLTPGWSVAHYMSLSVGAACVGGDQVVGEGPTTSEQTHRDGPGEQPRGSSSQQSATAEPSRLGILCADISSLTVAWSARAQVAALTDDQWPLQCRGCCAQQRAVAGVLKHLMLGGAGTTPAQQRGTEPNDTVSWIRHSKVHVRTHLIATPKVALQSSDDLSLPHPFASTQLLR